MREQGATHGLLVQKNHALFGVASLLRLSCWIRFGVLATDESLATHQSGIWNESMESTLSHATVVPLLVKQVVKKYVCKHRS